MTVWQPRRRRERAGARAPAKVVSPQEAAWARAVGVIADISKRGWDSVPVTLVIGLLSLDEAKAAAAKAWADERLAIPEEADPLTGCLPVTARRSGPAA